MKKISKLIYFLSVMVKESVFLVLIFPVVMFYVYWLMSLYSNEVFEFGFFITSDFAVGVSAIISFVVLTIKVGLQDRTDNKKSSLIISEDKESPESDKSWIDEGCFTVEMYMTEEQIGRLVKHYMKKTNGMPLRIFFPEFDRDGLNENTMNSSEGGVLKRIDENRELLELLYKDASDFIYEHPWVIEWFKSQDRFLFQLAEKTTTKEFNSIRVRPFPIDCKK